MEKIFVALTDQIDGNVSLDKSKERTHYELSLG